MEPEFAPVYFYIPQDQLSGHLPESPDQYWPWRTRHTRRERFLGKFDWTLQTYLHLKRAGFSCELTTGSPSSGILVAHKDFLDDFPRPGPATFLVCLKSDRPPHTSAQMHVVQNPCDKVHLYRAQYADSYFIPHWIQPLLQGRDPRRKDRFETAGYVGCDIELSPEFKTPAWSRRVQTLGMGWEMITDAEQWAKYDQLDVVVAVRRCHAKGDAFHHKPATKLYNAWHAGVPAILGNESAYLAEKKSDLDYIAADSPDDVFDALKRLHQDVDLRRRMTENGKQRAVETRPEALCRQWVRLFTEVVPPHYHRWCRSGLSRRGYLARCAIGRRLSRTKSLLAGMKRAVAALPLGKAIGS